MLRNNFIINKHTVMRKAIIVVFIILFSVQTILGQIIIANTYVVNMETYDTIQGEYISGSVTFNPETRTLTLEDATIFERTPQYMESSDGVLVFAGTYSDRLDTVNVKLLGENVLVAHSPFSWGFTGMYCTKLNIIGPGSLIVTGFPGISLDYVQILTIQEGATVRFPQPVAMELDYVGISSHYERTHVLIDSSTFICEAGIPFKNIADLQLSRCYISIPENAYFNEQTGTILDADNAQVSGFFSIIPGSGTAVPQYSHETNIILYPNPTNEIVHIKCGIDDTQWDGAKVEIFDIYGNLLQTAHVTSGTATINVSRLANSLYFVRVMKGASIVNMTFVKR